MSNSDFIIILAWPEGMVTAAGAWYDKFFSNNGKYRVGHSALALVDTEKTITEKPKTKAITKTSVKSIEAKSTKTGTKSNTKKTPEKTKSQTEKANNTKENKADSVTEKKTEK